MRGIPNIVAALGVALLFQCASAGQHNDSTGAAIPSDARDDSPGLWSRNWLTGTWNGARPLMSERGLDFSAVYKSDNLSNVAGGRSRGGAYIHNIDATLTLDGGKLFGWESSTVLLHVMSNNGGSVNQFVGDAQGVSNIEAFRTTKVYQLWLQKSLLGGKLSALIGLYDLNSEFYVTQTSGVFLNSSFGIGIDFAQTGKNGPSIFPNTALGLRVRFQPDASLYLQSVVLDGMPGDPDDPGASPFHLGSEDGALVTVEAGYGSQPGTEGDPALCKFAVGAWYYTAQFQELSAAGAGEEAAQCRKNRGIYFLAERQVFREEASPAGGLALFARLGFAAGCVNEFDRYIGVGAVYTGLIPGRPEDQFGIALTEARNGPEYRVAMDWGGLPVRDAELTVEVTYRALITPWLVLQPDLQRVVHPGTDPGIPDATVCGSRIEVRF